MERRTPLIPAYHRILFAIQTLFFLILLLAGHLTPPLVQLSYCLVLFLSPILLLSCGARYLREKAFSLSLLPFLAEFVLAFLFVCAMVYGIWAGLPGRGLFVQLLAVYAVDVGLSLVGFFCFS